MNPFLTFCERFHLGWMLKEMPAHEINKYIFLKRDETQKPPWHDDIGRKAHRSCHAVEGAFPRKAENTARKRIPREKKETEIKRIKWHAIGGERFRSVRIA